MEVSADDIISTLKQNDLEKDEMHAVTVTVDTSISNLTNWMIQKEARSKKDVDIIQTNRSKEYSLKLSCVLFGCSVCVVLGLATMGASYVSFYIVQVYLSTFMFFVKYILLDMKCIRTNPLTTDLSKKLEGCELAYRVWLRDVGVDEDCGDSSQHISALDFVRIMCIYGAVGGNAPEYTTKPVIEKDIIFSAVAESEIDKQNFVKENVHKSQDHESLGSNLKEKMIENEVPQLDGVTSSNVDWINVGKRIGKSILDKRTAEIIKTGDDDEKSQNDSCYPVGSQNEIEAKLRKKSLSPVSLTITNYDRNQPISSIKVTPVKPTHPMWINHVDGSLLASPDVFEHNESLMSNEETNYIGDEDKQILSPSTSRKHQISSSIGSPISNTSLGGPNYRNSNDDKLLDEEKGSVTISAVTSRMKDKKPHTSKELLEKISVREETVQIVASNVTTAGSMISESTFSNSSFHAQSILSGFDRCSILSATKLSGAGSKVKSDMKMRLRKALSEKRKSSQRLPAIELELKQSEDETFVSDKCSQLRYNKFSKNKNLLSGTKVLVPLLSSVGRGSRSSGPYQIATVVKCTRICIQSKWSEKLRTNKNRPNCLELKVCLDKSYLRNGNFTQLTMRIPDGMKIPRHSASPIGSCVLTSFGVGILVAWRIIDDIHVIRSLWHRRGTGSAIAYLRRDAIVKIVAAAVGFKVDTIHGKGTTVGYANDGCFWIKFNDEYEMSTLKKLVEKDILSCPTATFVPICEQIKEAALFQIQVDEYKTSLGELDSDSIDTAIFLWTENLQLILNGLLLALEENTNLDAEVVSMLNSIIAFVEKIESSNLDSSQENCNEEFGNENNGKSTTIPQDRREPDGFWLLNDAFGGMLRRNVSENTDGSTISQKGYRHFATSILRVIKRAISLAMIEAKACGKLDFVMGLRITNEVLALIETVIRVRQKNTTESIEEMRENAITKISNVLAPLNDRIIRIGRGTIDRLQSRGRTAWLKVNNLIALLLNKDDFFVSIENHDWNQLSELILKAIISSKLMSEKSSLKLYEGTRVAFSAFIPKESTAETKTFSHETELAFFTFTFKWFTKILATPKQTILKALASNEFQEICERIFVRVFQNNLSTSSSLNIYASSFRTLRELRILKDIQVAGVIWMQILQAANEELYWIVSQMPSNTRQYGAIISKLFTLGVMHFHLVVSGEATDWSEFFCGDEAGVLVRELDLKIVRLVESFCEDLQNAAALMPYYERIDEDFLTFLDGVNIENVMKEALTTLANGEDFTVYLREKSEDALEHILAYLPKMRFPVEKRDIGDGWLLTCRGKNRQDPLQLSSVQLKRENLICRILGSGNLLGPLGILSNELKSPNQIFPEKRQESSNDIIHKSILNNISELLLNARKHDCWVEGYGGVGMVPSNPIVARSLQDLPISSVLNSAIELWEDMEIDDDELMEIAIRDVSYQIKLHSETQPSLQDSTKQNYSSRETSKNSTKTGHSKRIFNPRKDPTLLYLKLTGLTLHLEDFSFRLEPKDAYSKFDPVFEGNGSLSIEEASIIVRVECYKERSKQRSGKPFHPVLRLREYEFELDGIDLSFQETGFDWFLNYAISGFRDIISDLVAQNMRDEVLQQIRVSLSQVNELFERNSDFALRILRIHIDDLDEDII